MKSPQILKNIALAMLAIISTACIEEYDVSKLTNVQAEELFARGEIKVGAESYVSLQRATRLNDWTERYVDDAEVYVVGENGFRSAKGKFNEYTHMYEIDTYDAMPGMRYRMEIKSGNDEFVSSFMELLDTPEISKLYYEINKSKGVVEIYADVDNLNGNENYLWTFEEDFEVKAPLKVERLFYDEGFIIRYSDLLYNFWEPQEHINCWAKQNSTSIDLYTVSNLSQASVKRHKVAEVPGDGIKFDGLYCITVFLNAITEDVYDYYHELKRQTELSGSIFTPMPSDVRGNFTCTSNKAKLLRGTVTASNPTAKRLFIDREEVLEILNQSFGEAYLKPDPRMPIKNFREDIAQRVSDGYLIWSSQQDYWAATPANTRFYYPHMCNCISRGGTPFKPYWWPN